MQWLNVVAESYGDLFTSLNIIFHHGIKAVASKVEIKMKKKTFTKLSYFCSKHLNEHSQTRFFSYWHVNSIHASNNKMTNCYYHMKHMMMHDIIHQIKAK